MRIGLVTRYDQPVHWGRRIAEAAGVLTIGRREDSTTFDPIKTAQNIDFWVFANVYDVLIRVDKTGTKLEPGLAESWEVSPDGLTYTLKLRDAKFSDGSDLTADDAVFSLHPHPRRRGLAVGATLQGDGYGRGDRSEDRHVKLKQPSAPFLATLAFPIASVLSKKGFETLGRRSLCRDAHRLRRLHRQGMAARRPRHPGEEPEFLGGRPRQPRRRRVDLRAGRQHPHAERAGRRARHRDLRAVLARRRTAEGSRTSPSISTRRPARITC